MFDRLEKYDYLRTEIRDGKDGWKYSTGGYGTVGFQAIL